MALAGEAFVFDLRGGGWTQYTAQPNASALYSHHMATAAVYAGDDNSGGSSGGVWRLETGADDAGTAIAWAWQDKERGAAGDYRDVTLVSLRVRSGAAASNTVTAALTQNEGAATLSSKALTLPADNTLPRLATWRPLPQADGESARVRLSGSSSGALEIDRAHVVVGGRGDVK